MTSMASVRRFAPFSTVLLVVIISLLPLTSAHAFHKRALPPPPLAHFTLTPSHTTYELLSSSKYNLTLHTLLKPSSDLIEVTLELNGTAKFNATRRPWVGIGWGADTMLDAEFVVCRGLGPEESGNATERGVEVEERSPPGQYAWPVGSTFDFVVAVHDCSWM